MFKNFIIVGIGSFFGGGMRYVTNLLASKIIHFSFPIGTITVNILGSFIIGLLFGLGIKSELISEELKLLLITGFCGGFTTFSTFSLDTYSLFKEGQYFYAFSYVGISIIVGFSATLMAIKLVNA